MSFIESFRATRRVDRSVVTAADAAYWGKPFERALRPDERLLIGLVQSRPTHFLTLNSSALDVAEVPGAFRSLRQRVELRMNRGRKTKRRLIYFACAADADNKAGAHLHALIWGFLPLESVLAPQAKLVGFGSPQVKRIPDPPRIGSKEIVPYDLFQIVAYIVGQHAPVFNTIHHERHRPLRPSRWRFMRPQDKTLRKECPQLLSALDRAQSHSVSDLELVQHWPLFIRGMRRASV